jgi:hypothetical protein
MAVDGPEHRGREQRGDLLWRRTIKPILFLTMLSVTIMSGCTSYRPAGAGDHGFTDIQTGDDEFEIAFRGNGSAVRVQEYALLRAGEVAFAHGFPYFAIVQPQRRSRRSSQMAQEVVTSGDTQTTNRQTESEAARFVATTYAVNVPPVRHAAFDLHIRFRIQCFKEQTHGIRMFDAKLLQESIRTKYGIKAKD